MQAGVPTTSSPSPSPSIELFKVPKGGREKIAKDLSERVGGAEGVPDQEPARPESPVPGGQEFPLAGPDGRGPGRKAQLAAGAARRDDRSPGRSRLAAASAIPEIRDYERINAELVRALDAGCRRVRLAGAEGQRFLAAGLSGGWNAVVEVEGHAGPRARRGPGCPGPDRRLPRPAADGAGRGLRAGRLVILGDAGEASVTPMRGGHAPRRRGAGPGPA